MRKTFHAGLVTRAFLAIVLSGCANGAGHVQNDPGGASVGGSPGGGIGNTGAVPNDMETHASGAMNGFAADNGDPVTNSGNLGSGSTESDPMNGINSMNGPIIPF